MSIEELSPAEQQVMEVVWERGEVTAREARTALAEKRFPAAASAFS